MCGLLFTESEEEMKGKPWSVEEEKQLRSLVEAKLPLVVVAAKLQKPDEAVRQKIRRLGLEVVEQQRSVCSTTSRLVLPEELPSVEEALKMLAAALKAACTSGLDKVEVQRLQVVSTIARTYKEILVDYVDYRGLEAELLELREKYAELVKNTPNAAT
jgi:hypothetical protein